MKITSFNPSTEKANGVFDTLTKEEALAVASDVKSSFNSWKNLSVKERASYLQKLAVVLKKNSRKYGEIITREMGKPLKSAVAEVEKCSWAAEFFAENAEKWLEDEQVQIDRRKAFIAFEPLGEILCVMPWNYPFWQLIRCAVPAMAAGNVCLLRHSNVVPMCALAIEEAFSEAGFPKNTFRTVITDHETVDHLIRSKFMDGVSVTGSIEVGKHIAALAGENMKKCVLELGGSDPFIVLDDADIVLTCSNAANARLINGGQTCIAAKRFIVTKKKAKEFTQKFVEFMKAAKVGDPMDNDTMVGPMVNRQQLDKLSAQMEDAVNKGAKILLGGKRLDRIGYFFEPTVITCIKEDMVVAREEVFGPIAPIIEVDNEEEALSVANSTSFGLGGSVWTKDLEKGEQFARRMEEGLVYVNDTVKSDPRLPFGGIKDSGIGRELSRYGLLEFVNVKSIVINTE